MSKERVPFTDAIALSSPSGRMSKRARKAAEERLRVELFGEKGMPWPTCQQPTEVERLRRDAKMYRDLAARGMKPRAYPKLAAQMEAKADALAEVQ